ncbi:MAG: 30S ribosomal protein S1 [Desulfobacterales bacterium]|nr:MAG: 30S ribosomal protein S1 [Desulfobacterales bacterium]
MTDHLTDETNEDNEKSFAELLDSFAAANGADIQIGDKIRGKIIAIGRDTVFVDTGTKIDAVVEKAELLDENQHLPYGEGDTLELFVVGLTENEIKLSRALSGIGGLYLLKDAFEKAVPVEGKIKATCKGGLNIEVMQRRAFCPVSQLDLKFVDNPEDYVGQTLTFLITQFEENGRNIVLSRRQLLAQEQEKSKKQFLANLAVGTILEGRVTKLMPYGAFLELSAGVEGMVHVSELSWSKVEKPEDVVQVGDLLSAKVIEVEAGKRPDQTKIALSVKKVGEDPWNRVAEEFHVGQRVKGRVTRCMSFGAFVEIAPGIEGLIHISEMSYRKRVVKSEDVVTPGETVPVLIKDIDSAHRRISLSLREAEGDPWLEVADKFAVGQSTEGPIEKKEKFGYFITLAPGITGLLPKSKLNKLANPASIEKLREGDPIPVIVEEIKLHERKITLAPGDAANERDWRKYAQGPPPALGSLGEKLQQALVSKKDRSPE